MEVPQKSRRIIQDRVTRLCSESFTWDDVKLLLIELREYLSRRSKLKELAHFIAHPERDRGELFSHIDYAFYRASAMMKQFNKDQKFSLDITRIPEDVYRVVEWHYDRIKCNPPNLKFFKRSYQTDNAGFYTLKVPLDQRHYDFIEDATSIISFQSAFDQKDIFVEL